MRRNVPPVKPPVVMSYSQTFQRPVHAGTLLIVAVFDVGQRIENTIFLPSYEVSGRRRRPCPA